MSFLIPDILSSFLGSSRSHHESNGQIAFDCPVCSEEGGHMGGDGKGNLEVNYIDGVYNCWKCSGTHGTHGTIGKLIYRHGSKDNMRDYLLVKPDYAYLQSERDNKEVAEIIVTLPEGYKRLSDCNSFQWKYGEVMAYLKKRGITKEMIDYYNIGYTTEGTHHDRIIIPSYDKNGTLNYYIARAWSKYAKPKYLNPDAEKMGLIFNEEKLNLDATIFLVEGVFDHIVIPNSIPLLGKLVSDTLWLTLQSARANIVIVLDADAIEDAKALYLKLNSGNLRGRVIICEIPNNNDPSTIFEKLGANGIQKLLRNWCITPSESKL